MLAETVTVPSFNPYNLSAQEVRLKDGEAVTRPGLPNPRVCGLDHRTHYLECSIAVSSHQSPTVPAPALL